MNYHSPLTCSPLTTHHSPLTTYHSPLTTRNNRGHCTGLFLHSAPAVLSGRPDGRKPHAVGSLARCQGLLRYGPAPARIPGNALHHQPGAESPGPVTRLHGARGYRSFVTGVPRACGCADRG